MPKRDEDDNKLYGVDPAWLREVISTWNAMIGDNPVHVDMPEYPDSTYTNGIRSLANSLKQRQNNPSGIPDNRLLLTQGMTTKFDHMFDTNQYKVTFGDVPANVESGDPVKRTDVSDMYDWMKKDVKYLRYISQANYVTNGYQVQSGVDGVGELPYDLNDHEPYLYSWDWWYSNGTNSDEYGYWVKSVANNFTVSFTISNLTTQMVKTPTVFLLVYASFWRFDTVDNDYSYVPLQNIQIQDTNGGLRVSGTVSATALRSQFSTNDVPYKQDLRGDADYRYGWNYVTLILGASGTNICKVACFFEIKSDYRHPETA